ncbi:MAG: PQQ-binding-like beta-propeller repeat protein [Gemmataceae bacterium]
MATLLRTLLGLVIVLAGNAAARAEDWPQFKFDTRHSGNVPARELTTPLGLVGAVPMSDALLASPIVVAGRIYVVDASGMAACIDAKTLEVIWQVPGKGGARNCNNVSAPAFAKDRIHFGTTGGTYYVLDAKNGNLLKEIATGDPIFSTPVVGENRVYFCTLGARCYAVDFDGNIAWTWDFVKEVLKFPGNRWSGAEWLAHKKGRVTWRDHFVCARDLALFQKTLVIPAGGRVVFLDDAGDRPDLKAVGVIPSFNGSEYPAAFGLSLGEAGEAYVQWHRRDNAGRVEILKLDGDKIKADFVKGTQTSINTPGLLSFCSVSTRGQDVYRCRPEEGFGFCKHVPGEEKPQHLGGFPSIAPPVLTKDAGVFGGLDGCLHVVALDGKKAWSFKTAFGKPITAAAAVCDGRVYFGCEDGYLYVLGPDGKAELPTKPLDLEKIRSPLTGKLADAKYDWFTNYGNQGHTNANDQGLTLPLKISWVMRCEGTVKHLPVCGGGRMYTHTAEGQIFAVEQETGRLLWRRYFPGVYLSFTSPLYHDGKLLVPQAGLKSSSLRCFDAATGKLLWEKPFTGSPSWSRQQPPVVFKNLAIYASGSGRYAPQGSEKPYTMFGTPVPAADGGEIMAWAYTHNNPYYPKDNKPLVWAWDLDTGKEVWHKDFSKFGTGGNDCGVCEMDGTLYYSTYFGYNAAERKRRGLPAEVNGLTCALDPLTGKVQWQTTKHYVTAGCTISAKNGRLYLGGYNPAHDQTKDRHVWCLDAQDGSLIWASDPVRSAVNVITVGDKFIFSNAIRGDGHVFDLKTGKIVSRFNNSYNCTRFTCSGQYLMGANMDIVDLSDENKLLSSGPAIDSRECLGAVISNGRLFYISQASGLQVSQLFGAEARTFKTPWEK